MQIASDASNIRGSRTDMLAKNNETGGKEGRNTNFMQTIQMVPEMQGFVKTFLPSFGNGFLKYGVIVRFWVSS